MISFVALPGMTEEIARRLSPVIPRACGGSSTPQLLDPIISIPEYWITRSSAQLRTGLVMTAMNDLAARCARSFARTPCPMKKGAQGRPGARRTRGLAGYVQQDMLPTSIQVWRKPPAFPAQWLYGLYDFVLVTGSFATIAVAGFRLPPT